MAIEHRNSFQLLSPLEQDSLLMTATTLFRFSFCFFPFVDLDLVYVEAGLYKIGFLCGLLAWDFLFEACFTGYSFFFLDTTLTRVYFLYYLRFQGYKGIYRKQESEL
jgi:hypothetical protein